MTARQRRLRPARPPTAGIFYEGGTAAAPADPELWLRQPDHTPTRIGDLNGAAGNTTTGNGLGGTGGVTALAKTGGGTLTLGGANSYTGGTTVGVGSIVDLGTATSAGTGTITLAGMSGTATATLALELAAQPANGGTFGNSLADFGAGDALDLRGFSDTSGTATATYNANTGLLTVANGAMSENFTLVSPTSTAFTAQSDADGTGTLVTATPLNTTGRQITDVSYATFNGTSVADTYTLNGTGTHDTFNLLSGNDTINGNPGANYTNTVVYFGDGNDTLAAGSGIGAGSIIYGNQGNDTLNFDNAASTGTAIFGGQGNDRITITAGTNYYVAAGIDDDTIDLGGPTGNVGASQLLGGDGNDTITGSSGADYIDAGTGNDVVRGGGAGSFLIGGDGNDTITVRGATNSVDAGTGDDTVTLNAAATSSTVRGGTGSDVITSAAATSIIYGNQGNDTISVGGSGSTVYGGQDSDLITITGGAGSIVYGNLGSDVINTGGNQATVYGGQGNDQIIGSNTQSVLSGNLGNDFFNIAGAAVAMGGTNALTITDFVSGSDTVALGGPAATSRNFNSVMVTGGLQQAEAQASTAAGQYTFVAGTSDGYLFLGDGNGGFSSAATLTGDNTLASLTAADISGGAAAAPPK